jgi:hypothetical protein
VAEDLSSEPTVKNYGFARVTTGNIAELAAIACSLVLLSVRTIGYRGVLWRGGGCSQLRTRLPVIDPISGSFSKITASRRPKVSKMPAAQAFL